MADEGFEVDVDHTDEDQWNRWLDGFADASVYQSWAYGVVSWGQQQVSHLVLRRGRDPVALAQIRVIQVPVLRGGVAYVRWGPVCVSCDGTWAASVYRAAIEALVAEYVTRRGLLLRVIPHVCREDAWGDETVELLGGLGLSREEHVPPYRTMRVDLTPAMDVVRKQLAQKWRNQLNRAEKNGLTVREGTGDDLYADFIRLYAEMMERKQFETTVDVHEFRRIQERLPDSQKLIIMIAARHGTDLAALVASAVGRTGIYLLGATSDEGMASKGSYLLQWRMMERLKARGCDGYDLGGINPERNPGVYHFKKGFGGQEVYQLGRFAMCGSALSRVSVTAAEWLQTFAARFRQRGPEA